MENEEFFSSTKSENLRRVLVLFLSTDWIGVGYLKTRNTLDKSINIRFVMYITLFMDIFFCDVSIRTILTLEDKRYKSCQKGT